MTPRPLAAAVVVCSLACAPALARLVPEGAAERAGLTRVWFTQAPLDAATQRVAGTRLHDGVLYVLTSAGMLAAYDAETGATRWSVRCGDASGPAFGPTVFRATNDEGQAVWTRCGVITGSTLHVLDTDTGLSVLSRFVEGAPGAAPALTPTHAFAPSLSGRLVGYPFDQVAGLKLRVASPGQLLATPILAEGRVIWATESGELYGAAADTGRVSYRYSTTAPIAGAPSVVGPNMFFANRAGFVYGMQAERARTLWRTTLGEPVSTPVVAIGERVYVASDTQTLYALDAADGAVRWRVDGLTEFVSASADRVFAVNADGALAVLDAATGEPLASWPGVGPLRPLANHDTDRLYFVSDSGLVQCLRDARLVEPHLHAPRPAAEGPAEPRAPAEAETPPDDEPNDDEPAADDPAADPFADPSADPFADAPADGESDAAEVDSNGDDAPKGDSADPFGGEDPFGF